MKLDLLTNATVVDDAIRFISENEKTKNSNNLVVSSSSSIDTATTTTSTTTNQVF